MRFTRKLFSALLVAILLASAGAARAQPVAATRTVKLIDFEERRLGNEEDLPMHWVKLEGPGLPHYVNGRLSDDQAHSGQYSFRFDLNGGSLIYRYDPYQIPVQHGAHYRVTAWVKTTVMANARARISGYLTDLDNHPVPGSFAASPLYVAPSANADWTQLQFSLTASSKQAAYLIIQLELLQPRLYGASDLGDQTIFPQDIHGAAWFDDVKIEQVPQIMLSTDQPGNIFLRDMPLQLRVNVNDRFTDDLASQLMVQDGLGRVIYQHSGQLDASEQTTVGDFEKRITLNLPALSPGWYQASMAMVSQGQMLGIQRLDFVVLADDSTPAPDKRFGINALDLPFDCWSDLPSILPYLGAGRVKLAVWSDQGDVEQKNGKDFDKLLEALDEVHIVPTACLVGLPPALADRVRGQNWTALLAAPADAWRPEMAFLISRHANHLDRWQLGADGDDSFVSNPRMRDAYNLVYSEFAGLIDKPDLAMPWPAWYDLSGQQLPATVALSVPSSVLPEEIPLYLGEMSRAAAGPDGAGKGRDPQTAPVLQGPDDRQPNAILAAHNCSLSLQQLDAQRYGRAVQTCDLAQRVIYARAAGATRIDLPLPMESVSEDGRMLCEPTQLFLVVRTLLTTLSGARYLGKVPVGDGVEAFLFEKNGHGILAMWSLARETQLKTLQLNLGERPICMDLWGNAIPLQHASAAAPPVNSPGGDASGDNASAAPVDASGIGDDAANAVRVEVGHMPMFLLDIDAVAAQMRASVGFDQPLLESSFIPHVRHLKFFNPSQEAITGMVRLTPPRGWVLTPSAINFSLNPGETFDQPIQIQFPYNSIAGAKTIIADFVVQEDRNVDFRVPITLNLGLSDVGMQSMAVRDKSDLVVQQMITNYGEKPIDYTAFVVFPGQPRQERLVTNLAPGVTTVKLYRMKNVDFTRGDTVRVGLKELNGPRILNDTAPIQ